MIVADVVVLVFIVMMYVWCARCLCVIAELSVVSCMVDININHSSVACNSDAAIGAACIADVACVVDCVVVVLINAVSVVDKCVCVPYCYV